MDSVMNKTIEDPCDCATCVKLSVLRTGSRNIKNMKRVKRINAKIKNDVALGKLIN